MEMEERDWYSVEDRDGEKMVHYHGWCYYHGKDEWSFVDLTGCYIPVSELLGSEDRFERLALEAEMSKQYQGEYPEDVAEQMLGSYYGSQAFSIGQRYFRPGTHLDWSDLSADVPCGEYWSAA